MNDTRTSDTPISEWLHQLADRSPTPGGGAAAGLQAAVAAALVGMVTSYTTGPAWKDRASRMKALNAQAARLRRRALSLCEEDARAFAEVGTAFRLPKGSEAEIRRRKQAIAKATLAATKPPLAIGRLGTRIIQMADELVESGNPNLVGDVAVAAYAARAAVESAIVNIEINLRQAENPRASERLSKALSELRQAVVQGGDVADRISTAVRP